MATTPRGRTPRLDSAADLTPSTDTDEPSPEAQAAMARVVNGWRLDGDTLELGPPVSTDPGEVPAEAVE